MSAKHTPTSKSFTGPFEVYWVKPVHSHTQICPLFEVTNNAIEQIILIKKKNNSFKHTCIKKQHPYYIYSDISITKNKNTLAE